MRLLDRLFKRLVVRPKSGSGGSPVASNVGITGTAAVGETLTGSFDYSDAYGNAQGASTYRWLRDGVAIVGATATTYVLVVADIGAVITFEVTPVSVAAPYTGVAVVSDPTDAVLGAEQHYLPFNGVDDYAFAAGALAGVSATGWSLVFKVAARITSTNKYYGQIYDDNAGNPALQIDNTYSQGGPVSMAAWTTVPGQQAQFVGIGGVDNTGPQVIALSHRNAVTRRMDYFIAKAGATLATGGADFTAGGQARTPLHLSVSSHLAVIAGVHTPNHAAAGACQVIAAAVVNGAITEAEVQAYSLADDARTVWDAARLYGYWPASKIAAGEVPNFGAGTAVPLTVSGPVAAELVAL